MDKVTEETLKTFFESDDANSFNAASFGKNVFGQNPLASVYSYFDQLCSIKFSDFVHYSLSLPDVVLTASDIPQFSCLNDAIHKTPYYLDLAGDGGMVLSVLGEYLLGSGKKLLAYRKYGENHAKAAALLGLAVVVKGKAYSSAFGHIIESLPEDRQEALVSRTALRNPFVRFLLKKACFGDVYIIDEELPYLSELTARRRYADILAILDLVRDNGEINLDFLFSSFHRWTKE